MASLVLIALLVFDASRLPESGIRGPGSTVGSFMTYRVRGQSAPFFYNAAKTVYFLREDSALRLIDDDRDSWDEISRLMKRLPQDLLIASYKVSTFENGFWAVTQKNERHTIEFTYPPGSFSQEEMDTARRMFADYNVERFGSGYEPQAALVRDGDTFRSTVLWRGVVHNAAALMLGVVLLYSFAWVFRVPAWYRSKRGLRRIKRGRCAHCGYDVRGLRDARCPECGCEVET